ncbi:hypothetical protein MITS9509_00472 [Synechococcus sp. MIT S9509]|nr:hypothetical protein MITS9504_00093 [Synechococcus sp. MIT S9504]KZR93179.1 hypothetical protein MITS9509_00472 [Synechococcus sp. MIT S9509]
MEIHRARWLNQPPSLIYFNNSGQNLLSGSHQPRLPGIGAIALQSHQPLQASFKLAKDINATIL